MEESDTSRTATVYYVKDNFTPVYVILPDGRGSYSINGSQLEALDSDPDPKNFIEVKFAYLPPDNVGDTLAVIAKAANAKVAELKKIAEAKVVESKKITAFIGPLISPAEKKGFFGGLIDRLSSKKPDPVKANTAARVDAPPVTMTISDPTNTQRVSAESLTQIFQSLKKNKTFKFKELSDNLCTLTALDGSCIEFWHNGPGLINRAHIVFRAGALSEKSAEEVKRILQTICVGAQFNPNTTAFQPSDSLDEETKTKLTAALAPNLRSALKSADDKRNREKAAADAKAAAQLKAPRAATSAKPATAKATAAAPAAPAQRPKQPVINKATAYYTNDFELMYVQVGNDFYKNQTPDVYNNLEKLSKKPDTTNLQNKPFPIADATNIEQIEVEVTQFLDEQSRAAAAAPKTSTAPAPAPASPTTTSKGTGDDATFDAGDVSISADPAAAKRATPTDHKVYTFLKDPAMIARVNAAVKPLSYTLAADGTTMTKSYGDRQITINENGGMSSNPITTGRTEKVAAILANDLIAIFRTYAILYQKGKDAALPDGIINLRLNAKGLSIAQERAHILLTHDVKERFYAELKKNPNSYPEAFLKKFKFDGEEIRVDLKRKAAVAPDATPDTKKPATATNPYLRGVINTLENGIANPKNDATKRLLGSILDGSNPHLAAEENAVKPKTAPTSPEESEALQKALGLLQEVLSKSGYEKATMNVTADSMSLPKSGKDMASEISSGAKKAAAPVAPTPVPPVSPGRGGRI